MRVKFCAFFLAIPSFVGGCYEGIDAATSTVRHDLGYVTWNEPTWFAVGSRPSVAINSNRILVAAYNSANTAIRFRTGTLQSQWLEWGTEIDAAITGQSPSVAINSSNHVIVAAINANALTYQVGVVVDMVHSTVEWSPVRTKPMQGITTVSVDLTENETVLVTLQDVSNALMSMSGILDSQLGDIKWNPVMAFDKGGSPVVSGDNFGNVVSAHHNEKRKTRWWESGRIANQGISWSSKVHEFGDGGQNPDIDINDNGGVIEVHQSSNHDVLYFRPGILQKDAGANIHWLQSDQRLIDGVNPSVTLDEQGNAIIAVFGAPGGNGDLFAITGTLRLPEDSSDPDSVDHGFNCGEPGEACCGSNCNLGAICIEVENTCIRCGTAGQPCCTSGFTPCNFGLACVFDICMHP
ncbi:MAG: hypothetical protein R3B09_01625 [Nannocystaceae bacterium]